MAEEDHKELKIVFIGDSGVGKTTTIQRYITSSFQKNLQPTVGTMFFSKTIEINEKEYRLQVPKTAQKCPKKAQNGQIRLFSIF